MEASLLIPKQEIEIRHKVKDSKFYGNICSASNRKEAEKKIDKVKSVYHDASHNVYAYVIGSGDQAIKYADDAGEPAGSSGPPILQAIQGANLFNTVIIISRYFGGTKLGIGGLIRAYGDTARLVIEKAGIKELNLYFKIMIGTDYNFIGTVLGQLEAFQVKILKTDYHNEGCRITGIIMPEKYKILDEVLQEKTANKYQIKLLEKLYF